MLSLKAKTRKITGKKVKSLRVAGILPVVLYGSKIKTESLEINLKEFEKILKEAGESTLISLETEGKKEKNLVLIHDLSRDSVSGSPIHVDFYQPILTEEIEVKIPLTIEGEAPAVKALGGTLVRNISEVTIKALPQDLPKEIKVNVAGLATFENKVLIKDLIVPPGVKILKNPEEIIAYVAMPEKVEEELEKPIEEKVEDVEKIEKERKVEETPDESATKAAPKPASKDDKK